MRAILVGLGLAVCGAAAAAPAPAASPVVLELFTSQGCSSCPPADALLGRLKASDPDVLPLSLHVDYWNRIGWRDPFSNPAMTARQYAYARALGDDGVYTPELVVNGRQAVVGSDSDAVRAAIRQARAVQPGPSGVSLRAARDAGQINIEVSASRDHGTLLLVGYDERHVTAVAGGENAGRTLTEVNVVRALMIAGVWDGAALVLRAALPEGEHAAVLLQAADGRILAARVVS